MVNNRQRKKLPRRLCEAAEQGQVGGLARLLRLGAAPDDRCPDGGTALYLSVVQGEVRCAELLLAAGASPNLESHGPRDGLPLAAAAAHADTAMVKLLLAHGADPELKEDNGTGGSALDWARGWREPGMPHGEVVELLERSRAV
ncbi:ankyrin repeat domain-containing protein [Streptomyces sp. NPDC057539]|uniref:ankyrin repeat domain-containing protein n=1 Tax=Streptomyces sp. NPDC057539 TaxID=3346159 RepID=UPI003683CF05